MATTAQGRRLRRISTLIRQWEEDEEEGEARVGR